MASALDGTGEIDIAQNYSAEYGALRIGITWQKNHPDSRLPARKIGIIRHIASLDTSTLANLAILTPHRRQWHYRLPPDSHEQMIAENI